LDCRDTGSSLIRNLYSTTIIEDDRIAHDREKGRDMDRGVAHPAVMDNRISHHGRHGTS